MEQVTVTPSGGHAPFVPAVRKPDLYAVSFPADVFMVIGALRHLG